MPNKVTYKLVFKVIPLWLARCVLSACGGLLVVFELCRFSAPISSTFEGLMCSMHGGLAPFIVIPVLYIGLGKVPYIGTSFKKELAKTAKQPNDHVT